MQNTGKKVEFIVGWFRTEKSRLLFKDQLRLVKSWTDICISAEEYEMAAALQDEKKRLIEERINEKKKARTLSVRIWYFLILLKRSVKKLFYKGN